MIRDESRLWSGYLASRREAVTVRETEMKQKKNTNWVMLVFGILLTIIGVYMLMEYGNYMLSGKSTDINMVVAAGNIEDYKGQRMSVDVDAVIGDFAETTHKWNGITTGKDVHYVVWLDDGSMIAVGVPGKKAKPVEDLVDQTWDYINGTTEELTKDKVHLEGTLETVGGELKKYYDECLTAVGVDGTNFAVHYYQIDCTSSRTALVLETVACLAIGVLLVVVFFVSRKKPAEQAVSEIPAAAAAPAAADDPYVQSFAKDAATEAEVAESGYDDPFAGMRGDDAQGTDAQG